MKKKKYIERYVILITLVIVVCVIYSGRLINMQVANSDYYRSQLKYTYKYLTNASAVRGEIYDRNGVRLVGNSLTYALEFNGGIMPYRRINEIVGKICALSRQYSMTLATDTLPIKLVESSDGTEGWVYDMSVATSQSQKDRLNKYLTENKLDANISAGALMDFMVKKYALSDIPEDYLRQMVGIRYDMERIGFSSGAIYTFATEVDISLISVIKEQSTEYPGVEINYRASRKYLFPGVASHILGRVGPIFADEYEALAEQGYSMNAIIGKEGFEKAFEKYLRGSDGILETSYDENGLVISQKYKKEPVYGKDVYLTIDIGLQQATEKALVNVIQSIRESSKKNEQYTGEDASAGSIIVMNPNNGEVLASASYPSFDLSTYGEDYDTLKVDKLKPYLNRALNGLYPPGSVFKIATATAGLMENVITPSTRITDKGIFTKYPDYQPRCWIYNDRYHGSHGTINVSQALRDSCNYFFYSIVEDIGVQKLNEYSRKIGLGVKTGVETGEKTGILAGKEYRESINATWYPGDLLAASIGQSDNIFTPVQMATMLSTVVNGGTRYSTHFLKSVNEYYTKNIVYYNPVTVVDKIEYTPEAYDAIMKGMQSVAEEGTAVTLFEGFPVKVGAKTGTAQIKKTESDLATFVCFAPFDKPEIVIAVVVEQGYKGTYAGRAAVEILNYYFGLNQPEENTTEAE